MDNKKITFFGLTSFRNQKKRFGIKQDDRRRHFYTIGKTGMGKSNMMENMAIQDIQNGHGVAYVDPHGEGAEKLLDFIPKERINDVIFLNPADLDWPIAFNVMEKVDFRYRHLVASGLMAVFKKVWPDVWSARMEYILNNCILALLEYPDSTLLGVNRMLADPEYRKQVVDMVKDPIVKSFWVTEYSRYSQKYETEATAAIQNKVGQFVSNALIRNIIGQTKSTINMREIMDGEKILILDLSKGRIGEDNSRLLGALLITKIQLAAMSRVDMPEAERKDFYLYVDEFQNFATESFANILSEARKYRLCLIVGHQYITQMEEEVRDAVFGNVGTLAVFRVGAEDAEFLEKEFEPEFMATDLVNLSKYNIYLKLMIDGVASHPFSAGTLPPPIPLADSNRQAIIDASRKTYGVSREIVEKTIVDWTESQQGGGAAGFKPAGTFTQKKPMGSFNSVSASPADSDQTVLYDATCSNCGKPTKTIFEPKPGRPVYCKSCLKKIKSEKLENATVVAKPLAPLEVKKPEIKILPPVAPTPAVAPRPVSTPAPVEIDDGRPLKIENVSFSSPKKNTPVNTRPAQSPPSFAPIVPARPKRKEINLSDLKKTLEESLSHATVASKGASSKRQETRKPEATKEAKATEAPKVVEPPKISKEPEVAKVVEVKKEEDDKKMPVDSTSFDSAQDKQGRGVINPGQKINL